MKASRYAIVLAFVAVVLFGISLLPAFCEESAYNQLNNMQNTGVTFDGSDGNRSGMDINVSPSSAAVNIPDVTPVAVDTSTVNVSTDAVSGYPASDLSSTASSDVNVSVGGTESSQ